MLENLGDGDGTIVKSQPSSDWLLEKGYPQRVSGVPSSTKAPYPYRVFGTGPQASFHVLLRIFDDDVDHLCHGAINGFTVSFHAP